VDICTRTLLQLCFGDVFRRLPSFSSISIGCTLAYCDILHFSPVFNSVSRVPLSLIGYLRSIFSFSLIGCFIQPFSSIYSIFFIFSSFLTYIFRVHSYLRVERHRTKYPQDHSCIYQTANESLPLFSKLFSGYLLSSCYTANSTI